MNIAEIKEILCGSFTSQADRIYWINKLNELERKEVNNKENAIYYKAMAKYNK